MSACARKKIKEVTDMTKKLLCVFLSLSVALSCLVSADVFSSADPVNLSSEEISKLEKYDGRSDGIITPVRDQGDSNLCWSYSSSSASEASILKSGLTDKSPNELYLNPVATAYRVFKRTSDPLENTGGDWQSADYMKATGNPLKAVKLFSMWWGPTESTSAAADPFENPSFRFENGFYIPEKDNLDEYISDIKEAVAKYGAVTFQYNNVRETEYYNPRTEKGSDSFPHACTVIGWDDTIEADRFSPSAAGRKGGWLVKNSYRSLEYFYLSYENTSSSVYAFTYAPVEKYDYNYYYDGNLDDFSLRNDKTVANVFKAKKGGENGKTEVLRSVNAAVMGEDITVKAEIYTGLDSPFSENGSVPTSGGRLAASVSKTFDHGGYVTLELENGVPLEKGSWFSVIIRVENARGNAKVVTAYKDLMTLSYAGEGFSKLQNCVGRIKAFTKLEDEQNELSGNFTNLIVPVRFADEEEFIHDIYGSADVMTIMDNSYNSAEYNVCDYYKTVSGGRLDINSVFLTEKGGSVKLSKNRGYYAEKSEQNPEGYDGAYEQSQRMYELKEDWAGAVNRALGEGSLPTDISGRTYDFSNLDKNGDGFADSLTLLLKPTEQNISVSWSSPLWNYRDYTDMVSFSTDSGTVKSGNYVQLTPNYEFFYKASDSKPIFSIGAAVHETGHILGLRDLYNSSQSSPVYYMSAMAKHLSPIPQSISPKEKEALGFLDGGMETVTSNGSYTLNTAGAKSGTVCFKMSISNGSRTLYAEYRNFTEKGDKYDNQQKEIYRYDGTLLKGVNLKSGLVLYISNSDNKFPSNTNGSSGRWDYEIPCGSYATKSDAALGLNEGYEVAGGIFISVDEITDGTLTFSVDGLDQTHSPKAEWSFDGQSHWKGCTADGCDERFELGLHTGGEATCITPALCEVCGQSYGEKNGENHKNPRLVGAVEPTRISDGYSGDVICSDCKRTLKAGEILPMTGKYGDANLDSEVNSSDALAALCTVVKKSKLEGDGRFLCDVDKDGKITSLDAMLILMYSVGKIKQLPINR